MKMFAPKKSYVLWLRVRKDMLPMKMFAPKNHMYYG